MGGFHARCKANGAGRFIPPIFSPSSSSLMTAASVCLFILAYLSAVVDGSRQPTGLYPEDDTGQKGFGRYASEHPWIVAGALAGIAGTIIAFL
jgi:hypothetical protein